MQPRSPSSLRSIALACAMAVAPTMCLMPSPATASVLDLLRYTYSDPQSTYRSELLKVAALATTDPLGHGNQRNITC